MKILRSLVSVAVLAFVLFVIIPQFARAADASTTPDVATTTPDIVPAASVNIKLNVEGPTSTIFSGAVSVSPCDTPNNASSTLNGFCIFSAAGLNISATWSALGVTVNSINGVVGDWQWSLNGTVQTFGVDAYAPQANDNILWSLPPPPQQVTLTIRDGDNTAFSSQVQLVNQNAPDIMVTPTNATTSIAVSPRSVLGLLEQLQASSTAFQITDLSYSASFSSFLINCIKVPAATSTPDCYNWTDAVDGSYPQLGIDHQMLKAGDVIYLFFGSPQQVSLSASAVPAGQPFTATAQQYDLTSGIYKPLSGVTIGIGTQTSSPPLYFDELATSTVDSNGQALFTLNATGTFAAGIKEDYYFPTAPITITDATSTSTSTPQSAGSGNSGGTASHIYLNIPGALSFISSGQNADGSFSSGDLTDWTALAFAAANPGAPKTKLKNYLLTASPAMSVATDYERHAMALEALGINPYSGTPVNYIAPILAASDGKQIGISDVNDDIFALLTLEHAGYTSTDSIIKQEAAYILSVQNPEGSWDKTADMTAAGIQALGPLFDIDGVNAALGRAAGYLASTEKADGSWGNIDSTSWAQTAINAIIEANTPGFNTENPWTSSGGLFPTDAIAKAQLSDGGINVPANRIWSTGYAVVAASGKSWDSILQSFPKPAATLGGTSVYETGTSTPTSTINSLLTSTSTPETATSTLSSTSSAPSLIELANPILIISTTTPAPAVKPKIKTFRPRRKIQKLQNSPAVLGASTAASPTPTAFQSQSSPNTSASNNQTGGNFFSHLWQVITSFFARLF
ncbi:MAG: hypothetical protein P4L74_05715 [Candidatus Doudnabacteria bacterium]|nr:hypothetical protein [Candidatus Doudnabacteria bacterium]